MKFQIIASIAAGLTLVSADALPWAKANAQAKAAADAYADAFAEAIAIAHPDPEAYALAASADDCASIACHASCGLLIIAGQECSENTANTYSGPYNTTCLCSSGTSFMQYYNPCLECGWTLWKYYSPYVTSALEACSTLSTEPTGTTRCSTTLSESYTPDLSIQGCSYLGNCDESTSTTAQASSTAESSAGETTSTSEAATSTAESTSSTTAAETAGETSTTEESTSTAASAESETTAAETAAAETTSAEGTTSAAVESSATSGEAAASSEEAVTSVVESSSSAASGASSSVVVSTFEGAAMKVGASSAIAAILFSLFF